MSNFFCRNINKILILGLLFGTLIRIVYLLFTPYESTFDDAAYDDIAMALLYGTREESMLGFAPGYPLFLSLIYYLFGHHIILVQFIQVIMSMICCYLCYRIACKLCGLEVAVIALILMVINPTFIRYSQLIFSETLFVSLLLIATWLILEKLNTDSILYSVIIGLAFGSMSLVRTYFLFFPFFSIILFFFFVNRKSLLKKYSILVVFSLLPLFSVILLNYYDFGYPVLHTAGGENLWMGNNPDASGLLSYSYFGSTPLDSMNTNENNKYYTQKATTYIIQNPFHFLKLFFIKFYHLWKPDTYYLFNGTGINQILYGTSKVIFYCGIMISAVIGIVISFKEYKKPFIFLLGFIVYSIIITCSFVVMARYRIPMLPFLTIYSAIGIHYLTQIIFSRFSFIKPLT